MQPDWLRMDLLFSYGFMTYFGIILAILVSWFMYKSRKGLNLRAVGESPATADAAGINVTLYKYLATIIGGAISGLGGLYFLFNICKVQYPTKEDALNDWYICTPKTFFYKLILFIPFNICMVMTVIMKNESNLFVFYVIGVILPYFFQGGLQFGGFILLCIRLKLSNESLYKEKIPIPIKGDVEHLDNKDAHHLEISVNTK